MKSLDKSSLMKGIPAFWSGIVLLLGELGVGGANGETLNFHHYDTDDGLPQVQVLSVYRDPVGYLWIGTYGGLSRYNGQSFKNYTTEDGLGANVVEAVIADEEGRLWAGTGAGLCRLGADAERFECLDEGALGGAYVYDLHLHEGTLWAATNVGFFRLNGESVEHFGKSDGLPVEDVRSIARDGSGGLWIGTTGGLAVRDPGAGEFRTVRFPPDAGRHVSSLQAEGDQLWVGTDRGLLLHSDGRVRAPEGIPAGAASADVADIALDKKGDLWVATNLGVLWRRGGDFRRLTRENGLRYNLTFSLYADGEGLVWIGHDQGLTKWVPSPFVGYLAKHGLLDPFVRTINEDAKGRLWLGTRRGIQIVPHIDGKWRFDESKIITVDDGLRDERVYSIAFPRPGVAMVATDNGVAFWQEGEGITRTLTTADGLPANQTQALLHDRRGRTWIGTNLGTVILENGEIRALEGSLLGETYIYRFREDARGRIWAAGRDGVFIVDPGGTITRLTAEDGLSDRTLWDLAPDGNGGMWAGSNGDGLFHVSADLDVERFTTEDGLVDNFIWQVLQDSRGDVWAYTNHGLSRFDGDRFRNFGRNDGLLHEEGGATGAWESHTGDLWFASADGLMRYDPALADRGPPTPPVVIERVMLEGRAIPSGQSLSPRAGTLDFHYAALSFWSEGELQFRHRVLGLNDSWSTPRPYRPVTFGNLGAGDYEFQVQARNPGGDWSGKTASFNFVIRPAYWETPWFWALATIALALVVLLAFRLQVHRSEARRRELEAVVRARTEELEEVNQQLKNASITDPLTGLHNRRFLMSQITKDIAQTYRAYAGPSKHDNRDIVFMMIDLDHFKDINDSHGHLAGDSILRQYAKLISDQLRESDYVVRWGGEEFLVVARQTEASQCNVIADRMIQAARGARFEIEGVDRTVDCTCSVGVSHFPFMPSDPQGLNWEQIVDVADKAVYLAKLWGRDGWVAIHGTPQTEISDGAAFLKELKDDLDGMIRQGKVKVESSFETPGSATARTEKARN